MNQPWSDLLVYLEEPSANLDQARQAGQELQARLLDDPGQSLAIFLEQLCEQTEPTSRQHEIVWEHLLQVLVQHLPQQHVWHPSYLDPILQLYRLLGNESNIRHQLLYVCSQVGNSDCLAAIADLLCTDPPLSSTTVGVIFAPLFQDRDLAYATLFPRLLDALEHPSVAAATLDLANHLVRKKRLVQHPASERLDALQSLLRNLNQQLQRLAEHPAKAGKDAQQVSHTISESVALMIAGCDTLALIENPSSIAVLRQTLELPHRRLQTEAAAALVKLGEPIGIETLIALAAEPVIRLHVLAYAEELGLTDQLDANYVTENARAEGQLALWLAHDLQMGIPPTELECVDQRTQLWPGYELPVDCYLIRYHFHFGESSYSNIGIVGPVTHSITADLSDLPPEDVYAIFAGWQAEHEDIYEQDVEQLTEAQRVDVLRFERSLHDRGYTDIESRTWATFLGDRILVAEAAQEGIAGIVVTDSREVYWHPRSKGPRPFSTDDVYNLYKGRKLLQAFNR